MLVLGQTSWWCLTPVTTDCWCWTGWPVLFRSGSMVVTVAVCSYVFPLMDWLILPCILSVSALACWWIFLNVFCVTGITNGRERDKKENLWDITIETAMLDSCIKKLFESIFRSSFCWTGGHGRKKGEDIITQKAGQESHVSDSVLCVLDWGCYKIWNVNYPIDENVSMSEWAENRTRSKGKKSKKTLMHNNTRPRGNMVAEKEEAFEPSTFARVMFIFVWGRNSQ